MSLIRLTRELSVDELAALRIKVVSSPIRQEHYPILGWTIVFESPNLLALQEAIAALGDLYKK